MKVSSLLKNPSAKYGIPGESGSARRNRLRRAPQVTLLYNSNYWYQPNVYHIPTRGPRGGIKGICGVRPKYPATHSFPIADRGAQARLCRNCVAVEESAEA